MAQFSLLDQAAEGIRSGSSTPIRQANTKSDKLHSTRLLNIEERPFKRITKRLLAPSTPIASYLTRTPIDAPPSSQPGNDEPTPDTDPSVPTPTTLTTEQHAAFLASLHRFREDVILDFASFDSSIARIQFLHRANEKQRQRYANEKVSIQSTSDAVRSDMERLKVRLEEAQKTLQVRKGYDVLAEKITRNKDLNSRDEQAVNIDRLRNEIEELEREGVELGNAWVERREQFGRMTDEGSRLRRVVRGEPEPDARAEGEDDEDGRSNGEGDGDGDENMLGIEGQRDRDANSNMGTPTMRPIGEGEDAPTPLPGLHESGAMTPRSAVVDADAMTPRPEEKASKEGEDVEMREDVPEVKVDGMDTT